MKTNKQTRKFLKNLRLSADKQIYSLQTGLNCYGNVKRLSTKKVGIILDLVIPCTFGIITYTMLKVFGQRIIIEVSK